MVREGAHVAVSVKIDPTLRMGSFCKNPSTKTQASDANNAYNVNLDNGNVNNDDKNNDDNNYARCVREHEFTYEELHKAYLACRRRKRNTINALRFEANLECNLERLVYELNTKTYRPSRSVCFTILKPKPREIFAADFQDRIVHHVLHSYLNPIFENIFIYDSFACRKAKGTLKAVQRVQQFTRKITQNNQTRAYYLQLDIHNFFMSINKYLLFEMVNNKITDSNYSWLAKTLIFHDSTTNYIQKSSKSIRRRVPIHKSLPNQKKHRGLPIGNLTSQFFANVYLNELDQFVKHKLKVKYYVRYVDDFVLLHKDKDQLIKWKKEIENFLINNLELKLKPIVILNPISNGINFVGYITRPNYLLPRNRNMTNLTNTVKRFEKCNIKRTTNVIYYFYANIPQLKNSLNSYLGHLRYSKHKFILKRLFLDFPFISYYFLFVDCKFKDRFDINSTSFYNQYLAYKNLAKNPLILIECGNKYRLLNENAIKVATKFDYSIKSTKKYNYLEIPITEINFVIQNSLKDYQVMFKVNQFQESNLITRKLDYFLITAPSTDRLN